jgi:hypothetical protein
LVSAGRGREHRHAGRGLGDLERQRLALLLKTVELGQVGVQLARELTPILALELGDLALLLAAKAHRFALDQAHDLVRDIGRDLWLTRGE